MTEQQAVIRAPNASSIWACLRSSRPVPGWWLKEGHWEPCKLIVCPFSSLHPEQLLRERNINWGHRRILKAFNDWGGGIVTPVKSLTLQGRNEANPPLPCHQWNGIPPPLSVIQAHFALTKWWTQIADIKKNFIWTNIWHNHREGKQLSVQFLFQNERIPVYTKLLQDNVCSPQHGTRLLFFVPVDLLCTRMVQQVTSESLLSQVKEMHTDPTDKLKKRCLYR